MDMPVIVDQTVARESDEYTHRLPEQSILTLV